MAIEPRQRPELDVTREDIGGDVDIHRRAEPLLFELDSDRQPVLSVVLPTLNEAEGIAECLTQIKTAVVELGLTAEIIVSDSSDDATPAIARAMGANVITPDRPGYGYAYRYAFERTRGEFVVIGDADTTYDFTAIPRLIQPVVEGKADLVLGSRFKGEIESGAMPMLHRYVGNPLLTKFLNTWYGAGVSDAHSGFRVIKRDVLAELELSSDGMEFASEMIMDASAKGFVIEEVPITYRQREGEPTIESLQDGWRHVKFMLLNAPTNLFSMPAIVLASLGVLIMAVSVLGWQIAGITFGTHTVIAGSLLTIVGYQVGSLAVFSRIAGDPIREPADRVTELIVDSATLEQGASLGLLLYGIGAVYVGYMVVRWIASGYTALPFLNWNMVAFTAIVLGVQTVFYSFFLSMLRNQQA